MEKLAQSTSKKVAAVGRELRYFEYRIKKKAQQQKSKNGNTLDSTFKSKNSTLGESADVEAARPQTLGEEDLQLQLALEMSKAESENQTKESKQEDLRLEMAIKESLKGEQSESKSISSSNRAPPQNVGGSSLLDLGDPWAQTSSSTVKTQPQSNFSLQAPPSTNQKNMDPFGLGMPISHVQNNQVQQQSSAVGDPWSTNVPAATQAAPNMTTATSIQHTTLDPWATAQTTVTAPVASEQQNTFSDPFNMSAIGQQNNEISQQITSHPQQIANDAGDQDPFGFNSNQPPASISHQFLGNLGADLVNLDTLGGFGQPTVVNASMQPTMPGEIKSNSPSPGMFANTNTNPFAPSNVQLNTGNVFSQSIVPNSNPFANQTAFGPTLNQMRAEQTTVEDTMSAAFSGIVQPTPPPSKNGSNQVNPFA